MSTPGLPDPEDTQALRAWLAARAETSIGPERVRTLAELDAFQLRRLRNDLVHRVGNAGPVGDEKSSRPLLRFSLDGPPVKKNRIESAVLGDWLKAFQAAVYSVAYALDELRPTRDSGPIPKEIQKLTRLYSGPVFASSYGMVLEGAPVRPQEELPGVGRSDGLLDQAVNRILDVADGAGSGSGAEDAVLDAVLPLGRRAISHLSELSDVLVVTGADVTLTWQSKSTVSRTSHFTADSADRCRRVLRAAEVEDRVDRIHGTLVGGSKVRGVIEVEVTGQGVIVVRAPKEDVTGLLSGYAERQVAVDVQVLTARTALGREHHSYQYLDISLDEAE